MRIELNQNLSFDSLKQTIWINGEERKLTTKETELFDLLASRLNDLTERKDALKLIWRDENYFNARSMDVYITKLRKILKPLAGVEIINVHGKGYKLIVDNSYNRQAVPTGNDS